MHFHVQYVCCFNRKEDLIKRSRSTNPSYHGISQRSQSKARRLTKTKRKPERPSLLVFSRMTSPLLSEKYINQPWPPRDSQSLSGSSSREKLSILISSLVTSTTLPLLRSGMHWRNRDISWKGRSCMKGPNEW